MWLKSGIFYGILFAYLNYTALMYAVGYGFTEIVRLLLAQEGIDINIKNIWIYNYS